MMTEIGFALLNNNRLGKKIIPVPSDNKWNTFSNWQNADLAGKIDFLPPSILPKGDEKVNTEKHTSWRWILVMSAINIHGRYTIIS